MCCCQPLQEKAVGGKCTMFFYQPQFTASKNGGCDGQLPKHGNSAKSVWLGGLWGLFLTV